MTYLAALGAEPPSTNTSLISPTTFNDTKFPGIIYATSKPTLDAFYELQNQLNRAAAAKGIATRIGKDGKLGTQTLALAAQVSTNTAAVSSLRNLAMYAPIVAEACRAKADAAGIPSNVSAPAPSSPPAIIDIAGNIKPMTPAGASLLDAITGLGTVPMIAIGAAVVGAGYMLTKKKGRR